MTVAISTSAKDPAPATAGATSAAGDEISTVEGHHDNRDAPRELPPGRQGLERDGDGGPAISLRGTRPPKRQRITPSGNGGGGGGSSVGGEGGGREYGGGGQAVCEAGSGVGSSGSGSRRRSLGGGGGTRRRRQQTWMFRGRVFVVHGTGLEKDEQERVADLVTRLVELSSLPVAWFLFRCVGCSAEWACARSLAISSYPSVCRFICLFVPLVQDLEHFPLMVRAKQTGNGGVARNVPRPTALPVRASPIKGCGSIVAQARAAVVTLQTPRHTYAPDPRRASSLFLMRVLRVSPVYPPSRSYIPSAVPPRRPFDDQTRRALPGPEHHRKRLAIPSPQGASVHRHRARRRDGTLRQIIRIRFCSCSYPGLGVPRRWWRRGWR